MSRVCTNEKGKKIYTIRVHALIICEIHRILSWNLEVHTTVVQKLFSRKKKRGKLPANKKPI